jgi:hypothetical protein
MELYTLRKQASWRLKHRNTSIIRRRRKPCLLSKQLPDIPSYQHCYSQEYVDGVKLSGAEKGKSLDINIYTLMFKNIPKIWSRCQWNQQASGKGVLELRYGSTELSPAAKDGCVNRQEEGKVETNDNDAAN